MPEWTQEMVSKFRKLRREGLSLTQIADVMGLSKGAVVGKHARLNRPWENAPKPKNVPVTEAIPRVKAAAHSVGAYRTCQFPIGENPFRFCDTPSEPGKPYCAEHCAIAYVRVRDRREDAA